MSYRGKSKKASSGLPARDSDGKLGKYADSRAPMETLLNVNSYGGDPEIRLLSRLFRAG